jgi:hypothetical protein
MVCLRNINVDTLHKGETDDDDDNDDDNNNNNNLSKTEAEKTTKCQNWALLINTP